MKSTEWHAQRSCPGVRDAYVEEGGATLLIVYLKEFEFELLFYYVLLKGTANGVTVVKVLCYKSEGRWFDSRWCHWIFPLT
jgi:hypothetical protein